MAVPNEVYAVCTFDHPHPGCTRIGISGELDACSVPFVEEEIRRHLTPDSPSVILDLADLGFIDSTGIRLLIQMLRRKEAAAEFIIVTPQAGAPRRALEILGLPQVVRMVNAMEEV